MSEERKPARLDFSTFRPRHETARDLERDRDAVEAGKRHGFTHGASYEKIDGRTLRRKGKVQLNIKVSPAVQREFKLLAARFPDADACMAHLLKLHRDASQG